MTIPSIIVFLLCVEVLSRFVPIEWFAHRAWESMTFQVLALGPFRPNARYYNEHATGDLIGLGNLPALRVYRRESFTTDALGYRNRGGIGTTSPAGVVLFGDSFGVGSGVEDKDTLTEQLAGLTGVPAYNAAGDFPSLSRVELVLDRLRIAQPGVVIHEFLEGERAPEAEDLNRKRFWKGSPWFGRFLTFLRLSVEYSPAEILLTRAYRGLQDDRVLPNAPARKVRVELLVNGQRMVFLPAEVTGPYEGAPVNASYWIELDKHLRQRRLRLLVLLVPRKYTVYLRMLGTAPSGRGVSRLDGIEERLQRAGIDVLNLTPTFQSRAAEALRRNEYLYFPDDTHWNELGIKVAAEETARTMAGRLAATQSEMWRGGKAGSD